MNALFVGFLSGLLPIFMDFIYIIHQNLLCNINKKREQRLNRLPNQNHNIFETMVLPLKNWLSPGKHTHLSHLKLPISLDYHLRNKLSLRLNSQIYI